MEWLTNWTHGAKSTSQQKPDEAWRPLSVSLQNSLAANQYVMNTVVCEKRIWENFDAEISQLYDFVFNLRAGQAAKSLISADVFLFHCFPEGEEGQMRNVISFDSHFLDDHLWMIAKLLTECKAAEKMWKYIKSLQSDMRAPAQKMMPGNSNDGQYMWITPWQLNTKWLYVSIITLIRDARGENYYFSLYPRAKIPTAAEVMYDRLIWIWTGWMCGSEPGPWSVGVFEAKE